LENYKAIANLITKYRKATLNDGEQRQLNEWLEQSEENKKLFKRLTDESYLAKLNAIDLDAKRKRFYRLFGKQTTLAIPTIRIGQLSVAAIFVVLVSGFVWISFFKEPESTVVTDIASPEKSKSEIKKPPPLDTYTPGKSEAVLSLDNGFRIGLDTVEDGPIGSVGNVELVKLKNGQIEFTPGAGRGMKVIAAHNSHVTVSTPRGGQYQLTLSDGSKVWLNASSEFRFPANLNEQERNVSLSGEAYFEVSRVQSSGDHRNKRFIVNVNAVKVYVIGTKFNIMSYGEENVMKTTLKQGTVVIFNGEEKEIITSGDQARIDKKGEISISKDVDVEEETAWKDKGIKLSNATLEQVIHQISRLYDIDILIDKETVFEKHMNYEIDGNTPLPKALYNVEKITKVGYKYQEGKVLFSN
jgi:ferric-dicitrate binding protein FerR (iron transport regulator)